MCTCLLLVAALVPAVVAGWLSQFEGSGLIGPSGPTERDFVRLAAAALLAAPCRALTVWRFSIFKLLSYQGLVQALPACR